MFALEDGSSALHECLAGWIINGPLSSALEQQR